MILLKTKSYSQLPQTDVFFLCLCLIISAMNNQNNTQYIYYYPQRYRHGENYTTQRPDDHGSIMEGDESERIWSVDYVHHTPSWTCVAVTASMMSHPSAPTNWRAALCTCAQTYCPDDLVPCAQKTPSVISRHVLRQALLALERV